MDREQSAFSQGIAWIALCLALALHVTDEALNDFLSVYNPTVQAIQQRFPFLPLPTFTFEIWLGGLICGIVILLMLTPFVLRRMRWMRPVSYILAVMMLINGLQHIAASIYLGRWMPGVFSSPLLIAASIALLYHTYHEGQRATLAL
jgi:hypothetical protein